LLDLQSGGLGGWMIRNNRHGLVLVLFVSWWNGNFRVRNDPNRLVTQIISSGTLKTAQLLRKGILLFARGLMMILVLLN